MPQFGNLLLVAIVQVLAGAENFDRRNTRLLDSRQQRYGQPVVDEKVRRECMVHRRLVSFRRAFGARIGSAGKPAVFKLYGGAFALGAYRLHSVAALFQESD